MTKKVLGVLAVAVVAALGSVAPVCNPPRAFGFGESESRKGGRPGAQ